MVPPKGSVEGKRAGVGQDPFLAAKATHVDLPLVQDASGILSGAAARPGKRHGDLPGSLPCQPAPLLDPRRVMLSDFGIGHHEGRALTRVGFGPGTSPGPKRLRSRELPRGLK